MSDLQNLTLKEVLWGRVVSSPSASRNIILDEDAAGNIAALVGALGYVKMDHMEYAADHERAFDAVSAEGDLFTDREDIEWAYEGYPNVTLMQRAVSSWVPMEQENEVGHE